MQNEESTTRSMRAGPTRGYSGHNPLCRFDGRCAGFTRRSCSTVESVHDGSGCVKGKNRISRRAGFSSFSASPIEPALFFRHVGVAAAFSCSTTLFEWQAATPFRDISPKCHRGVPGGYRIRPARPSVVRLWTARRARWGRQPAESPGSFCFGERTGMTYGTDGDTEVRRS